MKIETLLNIEDEIFFLHEKRVIVSKVQKIKIEAKSAEEIEIIYLCNVEKDCNVNIKVSQEDAFKNKKELLNSL